MGIKDKYMQTSANTLNNELDIITKLIWSFPGYPESSSKIYHQYQSWSEYVIKRYQIFKLDPMVATHEVTLVTRLIGAITKVEVNPNIAHPLPFSPVIQEMDAWYEVGNLFDLLHYLKELDAYNLRFFQRTLDLVSNIEHLSAFVCTECFTPHNTKEYNKHKNKCESEDINDQESENDDEESDKQHSEYEDEMETSTQYNEMQCIKCSSTFDCPSTYHGNQPLC